MPPPISGRSLFRLAPCVLLLGAAPVTRAAPIPTPNGRTLTPAGTLVSGGDFPAAALLSPSGTLFVADAGESTNTLVTYNDRTMAAVSLPAALPTTFNGVVASSTLAQSGGMAFSPDGTTLYVAAGAGGVTNPTGGAASLVRAYTATPTPVLLTTYKVTGRYAGGVAVGQSGRYLYVTEPFSNTIDPVYGKGTQLVQVDTVTGIQTNATVGRHPLAVVDGVLPSSGREVVVTANRDDATLSVVDAATLATVTTVPVGRHPAAMAFTNGGASLLVLNSLDDTLYDITTSNWKVAKRVAFNTRYGLGAAPSALAVSPDGLWAYVALSGDNAVGVVYRDPRGPDTLLGRIPTAAYPTSVSLDQARQTLLVTAGKGVEGPSPSNIPVAQGGELMPGPLGGVPLPVAPVLNQGPAAVGVNGVIEQIPVPAGPAQLAALSYQVDADNNWITPAPSHLPAALKHVVYVIRENKTYDEEFGDEPGGLPAYLMYGRGVTPNAHAIAEQYGLLESFYADEEVSDTGHQVVMGGQANDWVQRISQQAYGLGGAPRQGAELGDGDDVLWSPANYILDDALAHGITFRDYGEFYRQDQARNGPAVTAALDAHIVHGFPGFGYNPGLPDTQRVAYWLADFNADVANNTFPALEVIYLPEDHTTDAADANKQVADSDLATGQIVQALSNSPYWGSTAVFLTEDDPQSGLDHVDDHRTIGFVASPYCLPNGRVTARYDQAGMLRTIEEILGLPPLTEFDATARPMDALFGGTPSNSAPYTAQTPIVPAMSAKVRAGVTRLARRLLGAHPRLDAVPPRVQLELQWYATHGTPALPAAVRGRAALKSHEGKDTL